MKTSINMYFIKTFNFPEYTWSKMLEDYYIFYDDKFTKLDNTQLSKMIIKMENHNLNYQIIFQYLIHIIPVNY